MNSRNRRLFITGAGGLLGGHLYRLGALKYEVWGGYFNNEVPHLKQMIKLDIRHPQKLKQALQSIMPGVVLHTAAVSHLDICEKNPGLAFAVNGKAVRYLAEICADLGIRLIFMSSDMVFDGVRGMYKEEEKTSPLSVYGRTKVFAENIIADTCRDYVNVRLALIYGRACYGGSSFSDWILSRLNAGQPVPLFNDQFRSPVYVENAAAVLLELAFSDYTGTLHLGGSERIDRYRFGELIAGHGGYPRDLLQSVSMSAKKFHAPRPRDVSLCVKKAQTILKTRLLSPGEGTARMIFTERKK